MTAYINLVLKWNKHINLVGPRHWKRLLHELIADSLHLSDHLSQLELKQDDLVLDIGAGAGIPGIPLRIIWQSGQYTMIEPNQKRSVFLQVVLSQLQLIRTFICPLALDQLNPGQFTAKLILSRGFLNWHDFLLSVDSLIQPDGQVVIFSNQDWGQSDEVRPRHWAFSRQIQYTLHPELKRYFWLFSPNKEPS